MHRYPTSSYAVRRASAPPVDYYVLDNPRAVGPIVARFADRPIHEEVVGENGQHYRFAGVMPRTRSGRFAIEVLRPGEWIVQPGLIYASEQADSKAA